MLLDVGHLHTTTEDPNPKPNLTQQMKLGKNGDLEVGQPNSWASTRQTDL